MRRLGNKRASSEGKFASLRLEVMGGSMRAHQWDNCDQTHRTVPISEGTL